MASLPFQWVPGDTAFWLDGTVAFNRRYYYRIRAFDEAGNRSPHSEPVDYMLLSKLIPVSPRGKIIPERVPQFTFMWGDDPLGISHFVVKLVNDSEHSIWISEPNHVAGYGHPGSVLYNADGRAKSDSLASGSYLWRIDAIGAEERSGSESRWVSFSVR